MSLPKKLYRISITDTGESAYKKLRYGQRGGGTFAGLGTMKDRRAQLERAGIHYKIYETETNWIEIDQFPQEEN